MIKLLQQTFCLSPVVASDLLKVSFISNRSLCPGPLHASSCLQGCSEKQLEVTGEWAWLLQAFANHYGVRNHYAVMTHLRWVLRPGVASVSQLCFDLLSRHLRGLLEQEAQGALTQHEVCCLLSCNNY